MSELRGSQSRIHTSINRKLCAGTVGRIHLCVGRSRVREIDGDAARQPGRSPASY
jgi:hypothetical protein